MEYDFEVRTLSSDFYKDYADPIFQEILKKSNRGYNCLIVDLFDFWICVPFRSEIKHKNAYKFKHSRRSMSHNSGLDYSKMVIINNDKYIGNVTVIDKDEYTEMFMNLNIIIPQIIKYLNAYIEHIRGIKILHDKEYARRYGNSTLPYFNNILKYQ